MKKRIVEVLFQIVPVMIGVYLGFLVTDWANGRERRRDAAILRNNLQIEMSDNHRRLANVLPYHRMLLDSFQRPRDLFLRGSSPSFFRGLRTPMVR